MHARERQAENLALYLIDLQNVHDMPIIIHGKAYKPDVDMLEGSYSLLIGSYLEEHSAQYMYSDPLTGDTVYDDTEGIVLLAHNRQITYGYTGNLPEQQLYFTPGHGSVIVDPWRRYSTRNPSYKVIHYGNTRLRD
jgi:UDPglucose 6-dehydrogenase